MIQKPMIKKFNEFVNEEFEGGYRSPKEEIKFPCVYAFLTKERIDKKRERGQKAIGILPDGYQFRCENKEELENYKEKYKKGNKYKGETITSIYIGPEN